MLSRQFQDIHTGEWSNLSICLTAFFKWYDLCICLLFCFPYQLRPYTQAISNTAVTVKLPRAAAQLRTLHCICHGCGMGKATACLAQKHALRSQRHRNMHWGVTDRNMHWGVRGTETCTEGSQTETGTEKSQAQGHCLLPPPGADSASSTPTGGLKE